MNNTAISTGHPDAGRVYAAAYQATLERYNVLREELGSAQQLANMWKEQERLRCVQLTDVGKERDDLQQRLTISEKYVQRLVNCSKNQDSIATGYLSDILDVIKGNNV